MPTRITKDRVLYASIHDITVGILQPFNIVGYHIYGSGQTSVCVSPGQANLSRFDARKARVVNPPNFESSVTGITNGTKLLSSLIDHKIIRGVYKDRLREREKARFEQDAREFEFVKSNIIKRNKAWRTFHERLKSQLQLVLQDKPRFKDESKVRESIDHFKSNISYIREKYGWDLDTIRQMQETAFSEFLVKDTMET